MENDESGQDFTPQEPQEPEQQKRRRGTTLSNALGRGLSNSVGKGLSNALGKGGTNAMNAGLKNVSGVASNLEKNALRAGARAALSNPYIIGGIIIFFIVLFLIGLIVTIVSGEEETPAPAAQTNAGDPNITPYPDCFVGGPASGITHDDAAARLASAGISINSTGNCSDRNIRTCTSLEGVQESTIDGLIDLRQEVGERLVVRGGTEVGHAGGPLSHGTGFKVDIESNGSSDAISRYITQRRDLFRPAGVRGGAHGGPRYIEIATGNEYVFETGYNHWDILFRGDQDGEVISVGSDGQALPADQEYCSVEA